MTGTSVDSDVRRSLNEKFKHFSRKNLHEFNIMGQLWLGQYGFDSDMVLEYNIREVHEVSYYLLVVIRTVIVVISCVGMIRNLST
jgi:hypothetical protein